MFAIRAMKKVRAEAGAAADGEVSMEELLAAVSERVKTHQVLRCGLAQVSYPCVSHALAG